MTCLQHSGLQRADAPETGTPASVATKQCHTHRRYWLRGGPEQTNQPRFEKNQIALVVDPAPGRPRARRQDHSLQVLGGFGSGLKQRAQQLVGRWQHRIQAHPMCFFGGKARSPSQVLKVENDRSFYVLYRTVKLPMVTFNCDITKYTD